MTFGLLGALIEGTSDIVHDAITVVHRTTDDTLDHTGLSAFIPPALHEVSDGTLGLLQRGVRDVGHTSGAILKSFDQSPLHAHDKAIGGNLKRGKGSVQRSDSSSDTAVRMCKDCKVRPRVGKAKFCSDFCARNAESKAARRK